jgi:aquaporin Z
MYIVFQIIGAIIGAGVLYYIATGLQGYNIDTNGLGQNGFGDHSPMKYSLAAGFTAEIVLTFIFLMVILGSTSSKAPAGFAGIPIGISLVIIHIVCIPITGTSVNPARSIGPALFVGGAAISQLWLFIVAPLIGAVIAGLVWKYLFEEKV